MLAIKISRSGIAGLSTVPVFTLVLVWLLAVGMPVVQQALPPEAQTILLLPASYLETGRQRSVGMVRQHFLAIVRVTSVEVNPLSHPR